MPTGFDYSRFDKLDASDSDDEPSQRAAPKAEDVLAELPPDLPEELALVLAAREGQLNLVEALLDKRADVDSCDPHRGTALLRAVESGAGNRPVIELLVLRHASLEAKSTLGDSPISVAAAKGPAPLLEMLLATPGGPSVDVRAAALVDAAIAGNVATSQLLLRAARTPVVSCGFDGRTPLHHWAEKGNEELVESIIEARADSSVRDINGIAPLACAAKSGNAVVVRMLCQHGAPIDLAATNGQTALIVAVGLADEQKSESIVATLIEFHAVVEAAAVANAPSPLVAAACAGRRTVVELLLQAKAMADTADGTGRRALPCAAAGGTLDLCQLLLESRAGVNGRSTSGGLADSKALGVTALSIAAAYTKTRLVEALLAAAADPQVLDEREQTPLMAAAGKGSLDICAMLLNARACIDTQQSTSGKTAILFAAGAGHEKVCAALLEGGGDPHLRSTSGAGALHAAAANGHEDICRRLLAARAVPSAAGPGGQNAVAIATAAGQTKIAELLNLGDGLTTEVVSGNTDTGAGYSPVEQAPVPP